MFLRTTLVLVAFMHFASCSMISRTQNRTKRAYVEDKVQNYLEKFGYLPPSDRETGNLRSEEQLRDAIRSLQEFGNIPVTGEVDDATIELLHRKRCAVKDKLYGGRFKRFVLQGQKWQNASLTWSLRRPPSSPRLNPHAVRSELGRALDVWAQHSKLTFTEVDSDSADILVYFHKDNHGDGFPFDGRGSVLAHAFFPGTGRGGDAHFDDDENWIVGDFNENEDGTSLFAVAAHEFGHSLGLAHSNVQGALMYPWYQGLPKNFELPYDDRNGIQNMYGPKEARLWADNPPYNPPYNPPPPPPTTTTTTTTTRMPWWKDPRRRTTAPPRPRTTTRHYKHPPHYPHQPHYPNYPKPEYPMKPRVDKPRIPEKPRYYPRKTTTTTTQTPYVTTRNTRFDSPEPGMPDTCDTSYDAVSVIRGEVFIFKGKYFWRIGQEGLKQGYPAEIHRLWRGLPTDITHIDAVYERLDRKIVFFIGKYYYVYGNRVEYGYPKRLTTLGLPENLERIDAAMVWGYNSKTYLYSGNQYWKLDEDEGRVELDYPRDMSMWKGVGYNIDAVFQWTDGRTYFFKGKGFWEFNDLQMRVKHKHQKLSAPFWMGCPRTLGVDSSAEKRLRYTSADPDDTSSANTLLGHFTYRIVLLILPSFLLFMRIN